MKKGILIAVCFLFLCGLCFAADPVEGCWISYDEKTGKATAGWTIYEKNGKLFGEILSVAGYSKDTKAFGCKGKGPYDDFPYTGALEEMPLCGTTWIYDLTKNKSGQWSGGRIIDPNDGNRYKCKITFRAADGKKYKVDTLEMRGEIGLGIGRSQYWQKATKEEASALK